MDKIPEGLRAPMELRPLLFPSDEILQELISVSIIGFPRFFSITFYNELKHYSGVKTSYIRSLMQKYDGDELFYIDDTIRDIARASFIKDLRFDEKQDLAAKFFPHLIADCQAAGLTAGFTEVEISYCSYPFSNEAAFDAYQHFFARWKSGELHGNTFRRACKAFSEYSKKHLFVTGSQAERHEQLKMVTPPWNDPAASIARKLGTIGRVRGTPVIYLRLERVRALVKAHNPARAIKEARALLRDIDGSEPDLKAKVMIVLAQAYLKCDRFGEMAAIIAEAKRILSDHPDKYSYYSILLVESDLYRYRASGVNKLENLNKAVALLDDSINFYTDGNFMTELANALFKKARALIDQRDRYEEAKECLEKARNIFEVIENATGLGNVLNSFVSIELKSDTPNFLSIYEKLERSEEMYRRSGSISGQANTLFLKAQSDLVNKTASDLTLGALDQAINLIDTADGDKTGIANFLALKIEVLWALSRYSEAENEQERFMHAVNGIRAENSDDALLEEKVEEIRALMATHATKPASE